MLSNPLSDCGACVAPTTTVASGQTHSQSSSSLSEGTRRTGIRLVGLTMPHKHTQTHTDTQIYCLHWCSQAQKHTTATGMLPQATELAFHTAVAS